MFFKCKTCEAHKAHIKSLEEQIAYFKAQSEPAANVYQDYDNTEVPVIQPQFTIPKEQENKEPEITADQLLLGEY
jgi:hypothetical protein